MLYIVNVDTGWAVAGKTYRCDSVIELEPEVAKEGVDAGRLIEEGNDKYLTADQRTALDAFRAAQASTATVTGPVTAGTVISTGDGGTVTVLLDQVVARDGDGKILGLPTETVEMTATIDPTPGVPPPSTRKRA